MIKNLSEKPIAELQKEQAEKWEKEDLLGKCISTSSGFFRIKYVVYGKRTISNSILSIEKSVCGDSFEIGLYIFHASKKPAPTI